MKPILIAVLLAICARGAPAEPLTLEQAQRYMAHVLLGIGSTAEQQDALISSLPGFSALAAEIQKLDRIEYATPEVTIPTTAILIEGESVHVVYQGPITVDVAGGVLRYLITLPPVSAQRILRDRPWWEIPAWTIGGFAGGVFVASLIIVALRAPAAP